MTYRAVQGLFVVVAGVFAYRAGLSVRTWRVTNGRWVTPPVNDRASNVAGWSVAYGFCYLMIAIGLTPQAPGTPLRTQWWVAVQPWTRVAMATAIFFAVVLLVVVPWVVPMRTRAKVRRSLINDATPGHYASGNVERTLLDRLGTLGLLQRGLVRPANGSFALTRSGRKLARRIQQLLLRN